MPRYSGGTTCPQCKQHAHLRRDGTMAEHRTEFYVWGQKPGGRRRERCAFAGVTPEEAEAGVTAHKKRYEEYRARMVAVPMHSLDIAGLTDDTRDPVSGRQFAVIDPDGSRKVYGDQSWVAHGSVIGDGSHPDGRIEYRDITVTYGEWRRA